MKKIWKKLAVNSISFMTAVSIAAAVFAGMGTDARAQENTETKSGAAADLNQEGIEDLFDLLFGSSEQAVEIGSSVSFETTDLDGNTVKSEDIFKANKVTVINMWATWCGYCVEELPDLEKMNSELEKEGSGVIGVCEDAYDSADEAKEILKEKGVTYLNVALNEEMVDQLPCSAWPTTYFVDSEGRILTEPVVGADPEQYMAKYAEALKAVQ